MRDCSYLEEVLGDEVESLRVVADALQVGVLVQHRVVRVQEEVERVLVQEVDLDTQETSRPVSCYTNYRLHFHLNGRECIYIRS